MRRRNAYKHSAPRRTFHRWLSLLLCIVLALSMVNMAFSTMAKEIDKGGLIYGVDDLFNGDITLDRNDLTNALHVIIRHWHEEPNPDPRISKEVRDDKTVVVGSYIVPDSSESSGYAVYARAYTAMQENMQEKAVKDNTDGYCKITKTFQSRYINLEDDGKVSFMVWPFNDNDDDDNITYHEHFSGFSVSAGQNAVEIDNGKAEEEYTDAKLIIDPSKSTFVHLVKAHLFYVSDLVSVDGELQKGNNSGSSGPFPDYEDTENIGTDKYYNTAKGLHTDKTANMTTKEEFSDDRTFDLDLESWYNEGDPADVGMVLDASGSMGFTANTPKPIRVIGKNNSNELGLPAAKFNELKNKQLTTSVTKTLESSFLNPENNGNKDLVSYILNPHNTNNSPLRSSGYTYFLYDGRTGTEEFAPLGYWDGKKYKDIKFIDIPNNRKETDATIAYNNTGIVLGTVNKKFKGMAGWYYINPTSKWNLYINPDVQSGKTLNGVQFGNEVSYKDYIITNNDLGEELGVSFGGTNKTFKPSSDSPVKFYIDTDGYLRCLYYVNTKVSDNGYKGYDVSYVYQNNDQDYIKVEALQRALGSFVTELEAQFPASMVSAVRFSTKEVVEGSDNVDKALDMLVLGDWTADAREAQKILSNQRGQTTLNGVPLFGTILGSSSTGSPFADVVGNGIEQYNYGLTGNTSTRTGLRSFYENLATRLETFKDKSGTSGKKYLIVFTDGKDTDLEDTKQDPAVANLEAYTWANKLKEEGYTIYCVMLSGGPVKKGRADYDNAIRFLKRLSGPGKGHEGYGTYQFKDDAESKDDDYVYSTEDYIDDDNINASASGGSVDALINIFKGETGILKHIANDLKDYNVQDYIDPRFDLVDDDNNVWHLNTKGQIVLTDKEGKPVIGENGKPVQYTLSDKKNVTQEITLFDSKNLRDTHLKNKLTEKSSKAVLHYDDGKDMYYLVWTGQTIPGSYVGASKLRTWHSKITVRAKDDFIGGNAVLSNGNGKGENYVYYPSDKTASSGITESTRNKDKYPSKGFPRTTVNIQPRETEDEVKIPIYLDDVLENQSGIMSDFIDSDTDSAEYYYWEYLARYVKYYNDLVDAGEEPPELPTKIAEDGSTSRVKPRSDGKLYLEDLFKAISGGKLKVPYSYLSNTDETNQTGGKEHRADVLGYLTYSIDDYKNGDGEEHKQYPTNPDTAKDLTPRGLEASVTFTPLPPDDRIEKNDELVTEKDKDGDHIYRWDVDYKEVVGDDVEEEELVVDHETTIVSGEIALFVVMSDEDVAALKSIGVKTVTYTADLYRGSVKVGTYTHTVNIGSGDHQIVKSEISYVSSEFDYAKNGLPHGVYTLSNCQAKFIGGSYKTTPYIFDSPGVVDDGEEYTDDVFDLDIHGSDNPGGFIAKLGDTQIELGAGYETQDGEQDRLNSCYGIFIVKGSLVGDLKLTKTVKGSSDQKALFTFNVVLNMPEDMGNSVSFGGYTFKKESGTTYSTTVMLANGESVLFRSLPVGTKYKIDEINIPEGYKLETIKNASGEILVGDVAEAEGINKSLDLSQLLVTKRVVGITESPKNNEAFTFKVKIDGREDDITAKIYKYNGETWEDTGETTTLRFTNNITQFTLKDGEGLLLTDIDNGSDYTVTEVLETGAAFTFGRVSDRNGNSMNVTEDGNAKTYTVTGVTSKDELEEVHYFNLPRNFDLPKAGGKEVFMASLLFAGLFVSLLGLIFIFFALKKRRSM